MRSSAVLPVVAGASGAVAQSVCNGQAAYCDMMYSEVTFVGSHDSSFVGVLPTENQLQSVTDQLDMGIRFMTTQTHLENGVVENCHTSCAELDAGSLESYLSTVKTWMDSNPNEVVTLLITNGDDIPITMFGDAFDSAGLTQYTFSPSGTLAMGDWPTLGDLISAGTRLVTFMDYYADPSQVSYILDEFTYIFETPFDPLYSTISACNVDRPPNSDGDGLMILANHNLNYEILGIDIPDLADAAKTNSVSNISAQNDECQTLHGRKANIVLLDYVSVGEAIAAQDSLNGV
ncbi:PLC-like phosphodiesterase [Xylariaceae sp. FL0255]|nr:PLC-like phosphodiesterase [Xylariaceae sp. FL0255]